MTAPTYIVERDAWENRRAQRIDHDHRRESCGRRHFEFHQFTAAWVTPNRDVIVEAIADAVAKAMVPR